VKKKRFTVEHIAGIPKQAELRSKRIVADLSLDKAMLQVVLEKNFEIWSNHEEASSRV